ncbi:uncharacterized protein VTP21DRAFT_11005 [Calcarisporiella thermophila]|uniref:uncharacterized protein n=1 Tax=Calcarisporiella thermophila TaxID=911321 RepID=UPI0037428B13
MLLAKTYRIYEIFEKAMVVNKAVPDSRLLALGGVILAVEIILNGIWFGIDSPTPRLFHGFKDYQEVCVSSSDTVQITMLTLLYGFNAMLLISCLIFAWKTRNVRNFAFNESRLISFSVYTVSVPVLAMISVIYIPSVNIYAQFSLRSSVILLCVFSCTVLLFWTKLHFIIRRNSGAAMEDPLNAGMAPDSPLGNDVIESPHFFKLITGAQPEAVAQDGNNSLANFELSPAALTCHREDSKSRWVKKIKSSKWGFNVRRNGFLRPWRRIQLLILSDLDWMLMLRKSKTQGDAHCLALLRISSTEIVVRHLERCEATLRTNKGVWELEGWNKDHFLHFLSSYPGPVTGFSRESSEHLREDHIHPDLHLAPTGPSNSTSASVSHIHPPNSSQSTPLAPRWSSHLPPSSPKMILGTGLLPKLLSASPRMSPKAHRVRLHSNRFSPPPSPLQLPSQLAASDPFRAVDRSPLRRSADPLEISIDSLEENEEGKELGESDPERNTGR